jgi:multisubunit Na+/H+ antiporter MnhB subunit
VREYIRLADQKATFFFAGATALLAFLYRNDVSARWLKPPIMWNLLDVVALVAMVALAIGAVLALLVVIPRTPGSKRGYIFWEAIAEYRSGRDYADELSALSPATLYQIKAEHTFDLAHVCRRKYKMLRWSLWVGAVGLGAALIVFLFLTTSRQETPQASTPAPVSKPSP